MVAVDGEIANNLSKGIDGGANCGLHVAFKWYASAPSQSHQCRTAVIKSTYVLTPYSKGRRASRIHFSAKRCTNRQHQPFISSTPAWDTVSSQQRRLVLPSPSSSRPLSPPWIHACHTRSLLSILVRRMSSLWGSHTFAAASLRGWHTL